jgi:ubiquinol-cytochrome c reductase cytochrome b subunit
MNSLLDWLDNRTGYKALLHEALYERIPGGARWRYVWGSTLVFTFSVQMITGIFLWMAYSPSAQTAWESVYYIQHHMVLGWLVRGIHHFAAQAMVVLMALHLMQVVIDGAYKAPREVNFWLGLVLMQIVLGLSLTGYLLPWDQKGYYATQVATEIAGATPVIGPQIQQIAQGGPQYGHHTLTRFFALHTGVLPGALILFLALHIYVFRRHGITVADPHRAPETMFWPDQVLKDAFACLVILITVGGLAWRYGAELSAPANPAEAYSAARPEWYFLFLFRFLKYEWVEHVSNGPAFGAIYVPGALMTILVLMPLVARLKGGHRFNVAFLFVIAVGAAALTGVAMWEDKHDPTHQASVNEAHRDGDRHVELADAYGIPAPGAIALGQVDPLIRGPKIFAQSCAACHRYNGHDGRGFPVLITDENKKKVEAPPTATDLGNFGTREWMRGVLLDYDTTFAPLKNADWYKEIEAKVAKGESVTSFGPEIGDMSAWCRDNREILLKKENEKQLSALIEFMASQAQHPGERYDEDLVNLGRKVFEEDEGTLSVGKIASCAGCHILSEKFEPVTDRDPTAPNLTGYASAAWLKNFIDDPVHYYGAKNQMPAYAEKLSPEELDLLVRWMVGDYYKPQE